jgi:lysyl-tRNA synthetase class 1
MNTQQSNHWVDKIATGIIKWQEKNSVKQLHVDDMKTPSGRVHTGALRGVVLHDLVARALQQHTSQSIISTYVFNDMDPMDGLPSYLPKEKFEQYMGVPLCNIPAPSLEESGIDFTNTSAEDKDRYRSAKSFAEFYALDFIDAFRSIGCAQEIIWSHELYQSGKMDAQIRIALDSVAEARSIYKEVADYQLPANWYPFQVTCPKCGKVGTTLVIDWDGTVVSFECQPHKVTWAIGCGYSGTVSPFGGTGKLLWKMDWPAHWSSIGVTVEGAGKDHTSAGGSRDMANQICKRIFEITPPFDIPYEWILVRGAKMSSSKGVGTSAREFVQLFPAAVGRFLFINKDYNQVIDFDPQTMSIPDLFDEFDLGARIFWKEEVGDNRLGRAFELSHTEKIPTAHFLPRFRDVATWMQYPEIDLEKQLAEIKGSELTPQELLVMEERMEYAKIWVERFAPEEFRFTPTEMLPNDSRKLSREQISFLKEAVDLVENQEWDPQVLQQELFNRAKAGIGARKAFQSLYLAFLGKTAGPRAAWFLLSIPSELRKSRVAELAALSNTTTTSEHRFPNLNRPEILSISKGVQDAYPSLIIGVALVRGVTVHESSPELQQELAATFAQAQNMTQEMINSAPNIQSYRKAIKQSGIDWHSRRPTMDALLRRITKGQLPPPINNLADIGNLLAVQHQMSQGLFDADQVMFPMEFKQATGAETTVLFGSDEPLKLKPGEICYFDTTGPFAVDLCWRDAARTGVTTNTKNLLIQTEGVFAISRKQVEEMLENLIAYSIKYAGGKLEYAGIVTANAA